MNDSPYRSSERRCQPRRTTNDRRKDIRFEPEKEDRRQNPGRRKGDRDAWYQHED